MTTVKLNIVRVYGKPMIYPLNYQSELRTLTNKTTIDEADIKALTALGVKFEVVMGNDASKVSELLGV